MKNRIYEIADNVLRMRYMYIKWQLILQSIKKVRSLNLALLIKINNKQQVKTKLNSQNYGFIFTTESRRDRGAFVR